MKQITSAGWVHETSAQSWCTGKTQRDRVEREVGGGGSGWGIHVNPGLIHVNVWQNPLQYCKVISLQLIKINENKQKHKIKYILDHLYISHILQIKKWELEKVRSGTRVSHRQGLDLSVITSTWALFSPPSSAIHYKTQ